MRLATQLLNLKLVLTGRSCIYLFDYIVIHIDLWLPVPSGWYRLKFILTLSRCSVYISFCRFVLLLLNRFQTWSQLLSGIASFHNFLTSLYTPVTAAAGCMLMNMGSLCFQLFASRITIIIRGQYLPHSHKFWSSRWVSFTARKWFLQLFMLLELLTNL